MKKKVLPLIFTNFLAVSQNMLESYDSKIVLRSDGNQASKAGFSFDCHAAVKSYDS